MIFFMADITNPQNLALPEPWIEINDLDDSELPKPPAIIDLNDPKIRNGFLIDPEPVLFLHHAPDSRIGFYRHDPISGRWNCLGSQNPAEYKNTFPGFMSWLWQDAFFSVHSQKTAGSLIPATGLPYAPLHENNVRYLNSCHADIDCGRADDPDPQKRIAPTLAIAICLEAIERGYLPPLSMFAYSGRGVYLFWILRDPTQQYNAENAWAERVGLWVKIQEAIGNVLKKCHLPWDRQVKAVNQVLRVPGSINPKAQRPTRFYIQHAANGTPVYSLNEMAKFFKIGSLHIGQAGPPLLEDSKFKKPKTRNPNKRKGYISVGQRMADDWREIARYFQGWTQGHRRKSLERYAAFLLQAGKTGNTILTYVQEMASNCVPPYPTFKTDDPPLTKIVAGVIHSGRRRFKVKFLLDYLNGPNGALGKNKKELTIEIARELDLKTIIPAAYKQELKRTDKQTRLQLANRRQNLIRSWLKENGREGTPPSCRSMVKIFANKNWGQYSYMTIFRDYAKIGIVRAPGSPGRPKKDLTAVNEESNLPFPDPPGRKDGEIAP